jgi:hypothetical protein
MREKAILGVILLFLLMPTFSQKLEFQDFELRENLPRWIMFDIEKVNIKDSLVVNRDLNPYFLEADFSGDGQLDIALSVSNIINNKRGILIIHGNSLSSFQIGAGIQFGNGGDDFNWMHVWQLYRKKVAYRTIFTEDFDIEGEQEIKLTNTAISVANNESASNIIAWIDNEYIWIHTGD